MSEKWTDIEGYEWIYQITRSGKVRSLDKTVNCYPNSLENLEWCTHQQNMAHGFDTGLIPRPNNVKGEKGFSAKLKDEEVVEIKKRLANGERIRDIVKDYPIKQSAISEIKAGRSWGHIRI